MKNTKFAKKEQNNLEWTIDLDLWLMYNDFMFRRAAAGRVDV